MANVAQPLNLNFPIVDPKTGAPTEYFILWAQQFSGAAASGTDIERLQNEIDGLDLDDLTDVDTATTPPTDGQALVFDEGAGLWLPGDVASGGGGGGYTLVPLELVNPGAETGDVTGWTMEAGSFAASTDFGGGAPHSGSYFFAASAAASCRMYQDVDISAHATDIDNNRAVATGSIWTQTTFTSSEASCFVLEALDENGAVIASDTRYLRDVEVMVRYRWHQLSTDFPLPPGARTLRLWAIVGRLAGTNSDNSFDDASASLMIFSGGGGGGGGSGLLIYSLDLWDFLSGTAFATKGNCFDISPACNLTVSGVSQSISTTGDYLCTVALLDPTTDTISSILAQTDPQPVVAGQFGVFTFPAVVLGAGQRIMVTVTRADGTATTPAGVPFPSEPPKSLFVSGLMKYYGSVRYASLLPTVGDSVVYNNSSLVTGMSLIGSVDAV